MGRRKRATSDKQHHDHNEFKAVETLQAVVLADSFNTRLRPVTLDQPKVMLPLVNVPMLSYTLEFLASGGVNQIFVVCCAHSEKIKEYLETSGWQDRRNLQVNAVVVKNVHTPGDAFRELYGMGVVTEDFVLISGDVVSNVKLKDVVKKHKERIRADKSFCMTVLMKRVARNHRTRSLDDDRVVAMDKGTGQLLVYENNIESGSVRVDVSMFEEHPTVCFRYDLMDCHIDICSPKVLHLFADQFDYQDVRKDFIVGVLGSEILGDKIALHEVRGDYAARINDYRAYGAISNDIIQRWTYPVVVDNNTFADSDYTFQRGNVYKESNVSLARSAVVSHECVIGGGSSVAEDSVIEHSVLGRDVQVGRGCRITNSFVWGHNTIGDNVTIQDSVVCNNVVIGENSSVSNGCVLSYNVVIDKNVSVPPYSRISCVRESQDGFDSAKVEPCATDRNVVGAGGSGAVYERVEEDDIDEDCVVAQSLATYHPYSLGATLEKELHELRDNSGDDLDLDEGDDDMDEDVYDNRHHFFQEVAATVNRGDSEGLEVNGIALEVASLKFSHDATMIDYGDACTTTLISLALHMINVSNEISPVKMTSALLKSLKKVLRKWNLLLRKFGGDQVDNQVSLLKGVMQGCVADEGRLVAVFPHVLKELYELDVLKEEAVLEWHDEMMVEDADHVLLEKVKPFVDWLREASSEEDSSSDSSSGK